MKLLLFWSFLSPQNLLYRVSGWVFNTLKRLLSLSGTVCYPAFPCVCILGSDGSQVLILRSALPSPILPPQWGGRLVVHVLNISIYACKSTGLFPVPFRIQDIVLAGRECRRSPSSAAHQSRTLYIVWCRRWLWARQRHPAGPLFPVGGSVLEQAVGCLGQLLQRKLLVLPKRMLMLVTENRAVYLKCFSTVLLWFPCNAFSSLRAAVSLTLVMSMILRQPRPIFKNYFWWVGFRKARAESYKELKSLI